MAAKAETELVERLRDLEHSETAVLWKQLLTSRLNRRKESLINTVSQEDAGRARELRDLLKLFSV